MTQQNVGERVRRLRLVAGLGQVEFANRVGIASGSVSKLENGRLAATDQLLSSAARVLDCSPGYLGAGPQEVLTTKPWLRAYADASQRVVERQLADSELCVMAASSLQLPSIAETLPQFEGDLTDELALESFALDVRAAAGIDEGAVIGNTIRLAEAMGCLVLPMRSELGRHLGLSTRINGRPVICVSRPSHDEERHVPGDRQRFTVAHEIGHLALHTGHPPPNTSHDAKAIEKQAHRFAGAFLAPGDALVESLHQMGGRITLKNLASIKNDWGISIKALVIRFRDLNLLDDGQSRSLYKQISARGWNKNEPVAVGNESAIWMRQAIERRFGTSFSGTTQATSLVGLGESHLQRWTSWDPTAPDSAANSADILDIADRGPGRKQRRGGASAATVTPMPVRPSRRHR